MRFPGGKFNFRSNFVTPSWVMVALRLSMSTASPKTVGRDQKTSASSHHTVDCEESKKGTSIDSGSVAHVP
eukprot:Skav210524  [mRNA]  locus=scaffold3045:190356:190568:- [translate_table: standard]